MLSLTEAQAFRLFFLLFACSMPNTCKMCGWLSG